MRFPVNTVRCDSPHRSALEPGIPIITAGKLRGEAIPDELQEGIFEHTESVHGSRSYLQGFSDALLIHDGEDNQASSVIPTAHTIVPTQYHSFAARHPFVTVASLGAAAGLTFASTAYLTSRLAGRLFRVRSTAPPHGTGTAAVAGQGLRDTQIPENSSDFTQRMSEGRMRAIANDISDDLEKKLVSVLRQDIKSALDETRAGMAAKAAKAEAGFSAGLSEKVGNVEDQIVASNRDRRVELQGFRTEIMGYLTMMGDQITKQSALAEEAVKARTEDNMHTDAKFEQDALQSLSGLHRQIGEIQEKLALDHRLTASAQGEVHQQDKADAEPSPEPARIASNSKTFYPPPPSRSKTPEEVQHDEESRSALHEHIEAAMRNDQTLLDAASERPEGAEAENPAEALEDASEGSKPKSGKKKKGKKGKQASIDSSSDKSQISSQCDTSESQTESSAAYGNHDSSHDPLWFEVDGQTATLDDVSQQIKQDSTPQTNPSSHLRQPTNVPVPRIGVEDSGNWSFILAPRPTRDVKTVGWRTADVIYETSSSLHSAHSLFSFITASLGREVYSDVKIFLYPEFNIVRLDGQIWRCERRGLGEWVIREKLGDFHEPEWDGVGYEKE